MRSESSDDDRLAHVPADFIDRINAGEFVDENVVLAEERLERSADRPEQWVPSPRSSPREHVVREEQFLRLVEALAALPDELQETLLLRYCEDLSLDRIGERLDVSRNSTARRLREGLSILKKRLEGRRAGWLSPGVPLPTSPTAMASTTRPRPPLWRSSKLPVARLVVGRFAEVPSAGLHPLRRPAQDGVERRWRLSEKAVEPA